MENDSSCLPLTARVLSTKLFYGAKHGLLYSTSASLSWPRSPRSIFFQMPTVLLRLHAPRYLLSVHRVAPHLDLRRPPLPSVREQVVFPRRRRCFWRRRNKTRPPKRLLLPLELSIPAADRPQPLPSLLEDRRPLPTPLLNVSCSIPLLLLPLPPSPAPLRSSCCFRNPPCDCTPSSPRTQATTLP